MTIKIALMQAHSGPQLFGGKGILGAKNNVFGEGQLLMLICTS